MDEKLKHQFTPTQPVPISIVLDSVASPGYVDFRHHKVVSTQLMQGIAQLPALADRLTQECVQSRRSLKSFEAALAIEKLERERWENLYKDLFSKLHIEQSDKNEARIIELERKLDESVEAIRNLREENETIKQKMMEMGELEMEYEGLECISPEDETVNVNELENYEELLDARRELISGISDIMGRIDVNIGVKRMGELDKKVFINSCKARFVNEIKAVELCSLLQNLLQDPQWQPIQITVDDLGINWETLKEEDGSLQEIKNACGIEIYNEVIATLKELIRYNPVGRLPVAELWNFKENRKATLKEAIHCIFEQLKELTKHTN